MAKVRLASFFSADLDRICAFYTGVFGFDEVVELRSALYRGIRTPGGPDIGFHAMSVLDLLNLQDRALGLGGMLTFEFEAAEQVDGHIDRIKAAGGQCLKPAGMTFYDVYQAVAADPDGNALRLNFYPAGKANYRTLDTARAAELGILATQLTI